MATADLILALLRHPEVESLTLAVDGSTFGAYATGPDGSTVATAQTLRQAVEGVLRAIESGGLPVTVSDAARRATVRLPEGGVGTLVRVDTRSRVALVRTLDGRHRRIPARSLALSEVEIQPLMSGERRYADRLEIGPDHPQPSSPVDVS